MTIRTTIISTFELIKPTERNKDSLAFAHSTCRLHYSNDPNEQKEWLSVPLTVFLMHNDKLSQQSQHKMANMETMIQDIGPTVADIFGWLPCQSINILFLIKNYGNMHYDLKL